MLQLPRLPGWALLACLASPMPAALTAMSQPTEDASGIEQKCYLHRRQMVPQAVTGRQGKAWLLPVWPLPDLPETPRLMGSQASEQ